MFSRIARLYRAQWQALGNLAPSWRGLLWRIVLSALASAIAFGLATWLTPGITPVNQPSVVTAVILLGVFDVIVRPLLLAVALPIGLIAVALVGLLLRIIAFALILPAAGYEADSFVTILIASLIYGAVQTALSGIIGMSDEDSFSARTVAQVMRDDTDRICTPHARVLPGSRFVDGARGPAGARGDGGCAGRSAARLAKHNDRRSEARDGGHHLARPRPVARADDARRRSAVLSSPAGAPAWTTRARRGPHRISSLRTIP